MLLMKFYTHVLYTATAFCRPNLLTKTKHSNIIENFI